jgi:DNA-repair protein XRCC3
LTRVDSKFITTGCKIIDGVFGGVVTDACITELSGESGCGKTQLCLQLALTTQNPVHVGGLNKSKLQEYQYGDISADFSEYISYFFILGVVYICTEDSFPSKRLQQMINNVRPPFRDAGTLPYGDRIYVEHIVDVV